MADVDASADRSSGDAISSQESTLSEAGGSDAPGPDQVDGGDIYAATLRAAYRGCLVASMACADYPATSCYNGEFVPLVDEQRSKGGPCAQELYDLATCDASLTVSDVECLHPGVLAPKCDPQRNTFMKCNQ
jgi:hypothetical protein